MKITLEVDADKLLPTTSYVSDSKLSILVDITKLTAIAEKLKEITEILEPTSD